MNFLRLHDPLISVLFEDDEIVAVDKPYGIDSHTNDSKATHGILVVPGLIEVFEQQLERKLHIVHRLDRTTTGVIIFAKSQESAEKYRGYFRAREAKKTYFFLTDRRSSSPRLKSETPILQKGSKLEAKTEFLLTYQGEKFALWQASPMTGRNHQIRIHANEVGLSLLGDEKYGGTFFPFLCLHNQRLRFSNGVDIQAALPVYFDNLKVLEDPALAKVFFEADRRRRLFGPNFGAESCLRLVGHAPRESREREFVLEQYGPRLVLSWYKDQWGSREVDRFRQISSAFKKPILVRLLNPKYKESVKQGDPFVIVAEGEIAQTEKDGTWVAEEGPIKFELDASSAQAPGLYLDFRLQRSWLRAHAKAKSVLNLFAHTCSASVASLLGGASSVASVDTNKNLLNWGRRNFELNGLDLSRTKFFCRESQAFLKQCQSTGTKFDLIICTPPTFWRDDKRSFKLETALAAFIKACLASLNPGGELLFSTSSETVYVDDLRKAVLEAQAELGLRELGIQSLQPSMDFELPGERQSLASLLVRLPSRES